MENNKISNRIKAEYASGASQVELAKKYNVSQSRISDFLADNGQSDMNMRFSMIKKMFPNATIHLDGSDVDISLIHNLKAQLSNIKKLANDNTIPDDKFRTVIKVLLD